MEMATDKLPGKWSILGMRLRLGLELGFFSLLIHLLWFLVTVVRWLFVPLVLLLQLLFMVPFARTMKIPVTRSSFRRVEEPEVPDDAWIYFRETASLLGLIGFRPGHFVRLSGIFDNQTTYGMPLTNTQTRVGMGVNYIAISDKKGRVVDNRRAVELTAECGPDRMVDFTNSEELEPFMPASRTRIRLPYHSELDLLRLFSDYTENSGCTLSDTTLTRLQDEPDTVLWDEFRNGMEEVSRDGYLVMSPGNEVMRLTWKGALRAGVLAQWPLSVPVGRLEKREIDHLLSAAGVSREDEGADIAGFLDPLPVAGLDTDRVASLCAIVEQLVRRYAEGLRLASITYNYSGFAATTPPVNILYTWVLHEACEMRELERHVELMLEIDTTSGAINWLTADDGHYAPGEYPDDLDDPQPLSAPVTTLLTLQGVLALTEPKVMQYSAECANDTLTVLEVEGRSIWQRTTLFGNGELVVTDLDAVSGEILRSEKEY